MILESLSWTSDHHHGTIFAIASSIGIALPVGNQMKSERQMDVAHPTLPPNRSFQRPRNHSNRRYKESDSQSYGEQAPQPPRNSEYMSSTRSSHASENARAMASTMTGHSDSNQPQYQSSSSRNKPQKRVVISLKHKPKEKKRFLVPFDIDWNQFLRGICERLRIVHVKAIYDEQNIELCTLDDICDGETLHVVPYTKKEDDTRKMKRHQEDASK